MAAIPRCRRGRPGRSVSGRSHAHDRRPLMSAELTLRPTGISLFTLFVMSALLSSSALAQAPPFLLEWGTSSSRTGEFPSGVAADAGGHVYVSDMSGRIQK